jgi:hypothetical protein
MPDSNHQPTETSPLLPKTDSHEQTSRHPIDPSGGIVPDGADPYQQEDEDDDEDGGDVERQTSHTSNGQSRRFEGMPEVKKQMKWLFPAMGIGVCSYL